MSELHFPEKPVKRILPTARVGTAKKKKERKHHARM